MADGSKAGQDELEGLRLDAESLDLSALSSENVESAAAALSSLPKLKDVILPINSRSICALIS